MSERLTDKDLDLIGLRFPTHFGMPETSVLVQRLLSELRERRAQDLDDTDRNALASLLSRINANYDDTNAADNNRHRRVVDKLLARKDG